MSKLLQYRMLILLVLTGITVGFGFHIKNLTRDAGVSSLLAEDHPDYLYWKEMETVFGATDQIVVGISSQETIYTRDNLKLIHELTTFFEDLDEIDADDVTSLTNIDDMQGVEDELVIEPLVSPEEIDILDAAQLQDIRARVRTNSLFHGKLVSADERSAVIIAGIPIEVSTQDQQIAALKTKVMAKINELKARYPQATIALSGTPMLKAYISEYMQKDMRQLFPLTVMVVMLLFFFLLRSVYGMLMPILVTLSSIVWTLGLKGLAHSPLTIVETVIPIMLIAIGCADGVHIMNEFFGFLRKGYSKIDALTAAMRILTLPVILTSVTTALGFISLLSAPGVSIRNMGLYLAFGVMVAMMFSLWFIPVLTSFYRSTKIRTGQQWLKASASQASTFHGIAEKIGLMTVKHRVLIVSAALSLLLLSFLGMLHVQVESDEVRYFKPQNPFRQATEYIQNALGGITSLDIILEGQEPNIIKQPRMLKAIQNLQQFCEQQELVSYSLSLADLLKRINYTLHNNDPDFDRLPEEAETVIYSTYETREGQDLLVEKTEQVSGFEQVAQFLLLYEMGGGDMTDEYVDNNYQRTRITVRLRDMSSQRLTRLLAQLTPYIDAYFPDDVNVRYSNHYIRFVMQGLIIKSQIYSLLTVLVAILLLMSLIFRSFAAGFITSMPVFIAVLLNFAVMWLTGIALNIGTSILGSVGMGVGIDYAIHYFSRFRLLFGQAQAYDEAIIQAVAETARPILSNAVAVGLGFLVLFFSEYQVLANVGWITALSMFTTALSSLIVLPALLSLLKPSVKKVTHNDAVTPGKQYAATCSETSL
ncbi:MAG: efflux RND transporter permease subunit [Candidatus Vecturithrix sp.]|nr:efflux RND transporter permease subunit [Candidatus Vecturithrix sp.]